jgi:DUF1680 family protein
MEKSARKARQIAAVVNIGKSPFAKLRPLHFGAVRLLGGFWAGWQARNARQAIPTGYEKLAQSGVLENFETAAGLRQGSYRNMVFVDSDLYK